jgi:LmbE family N-acetylglucosaminyl deacetylase
MSAVALALMAHPDDAEILCAGTLVRLVELGWELHIATMTAGDCGSMTEDAWNIAARRVNEAEQAAAEVGANYHCLDERDGRVVYDKPTIEKTAALMRRVNPNVVFTHAPKDYMMDHEVTAQLARGASFLFAAPNLSAQPVSQDATIPHLYYCDPVGGVDPFGKFVEPTTYVPIDQQITKKTRMLSFHASQREWLRAHHGMDEYIDAMQRHGQWRGRQIGRAYAEAFVQHRGHAYPDDDMLAELFSERKGSHESTDQ